MISEEVQEWLYSAINIYDKLVNKDFLLICRVNSQHPLEYFEIRIKEENFWHLLGCKIKEGISIQNHELYVSCLNRKPIRECLEYVRNRDITSCKIKYGIFKRVFDFISNAKRIRVCSTENTPDYYTFVLAVGYDEGIIGYDHKKSSLMHYPKTTQAKTIESFNAAKQAKKIVSILSKPISNSGYEEIVFEYKKNGTKDIIKSINAIFKRKIEKTI